MEQQRPDDLAAAVSVGAEFGLGEVRAITLASAYPPGTGLGAAAAGLSVLGIPAGVLAAGWAQAASAAVCGPLFLLGCLMFGRGVAGARVTRRLYWYTGGVAEFTGDAPEPRVARWADGEPPIEACEPGGPVALGDTRIGHTPD